MTLREVLRKLRDAEKVPPHVLCCGVWWAVDQEWNLDDAGHRGCLLALLREAVEPLESGRSPHIFVQPCSMPGGMRWQVLGVQSTIPPAWLGASGPTEGEAIAAALVALAEAL